MSKMNVKKSLLDVVKENNLEILKIDLCDEGASIAKAERLNPNYWGKLYSTLESLDFEVESIFMHDEVRGMIYCQDKDTKEPVWIESRGDEGMSWWEVNRVPDFYKVSHKKAMIKGMAARSAEFVERYSVGIADGASDLK